MRPFQMRRCIFYLISLLFFIACKQERKETLVIIEGNVKGLPDGNVYLIDEFSDWRKNTDTAIAKSGHFRFEIKPDSNFYPYPGRIKYTDTTSKLGFGLITITNT